MAKPALKTRPPRNPVLDTLAQMNARPPTPEEVSSLRRMARTNPLAVRYLLAELCGVGKVPFDISKSEATHANAFRAGSLGVGIALGMIAGAPLTMQVAEETPPPEQG